MAIAVTFATDPFSDGLGRTSDLGVAFIRRVDVNHTDTAAAVINASDIGVQKILGVQSIVMRSAHTSYWSATGANGASVTLTASNAAAIASYYLLCQGT